MVAFSRFPVTMFNHNTNPRVHYNFRISLSNVKTKLRTAEYTCVLLSSTLDHCYPMLDLEGPSVQLSLTAAQ